MKLVLIIIDEKLYYISLVIILYKFINLRLKFLWFAKYLNIFLILLTAQTLDLF